MRNIKHNLDVLDAHRDFLALGMMSAPGLSKTSQINQWAEEHGRRVFELIISQRMPSEISGMPMPNSNTQKMEIYDFNTLLEMKDGDILFFDEFTNGNIQTLNACLTLIQDRMMLSGKKLPSVLIVAAGNPQGSCELLPQTKQRFFWTNVTFSPEMWAAYIWKTHRIFPTSSLLEHIKETYTSNRFNRTTYNYFTARTAENILRLAMDIEEDDPLWSTISRFDAGMRPVDVTYRTISLNRMAKMKELKEHLTDLAYSIEVDDNQSEDNQYAFVRAVWNSEETVGIRHAIRYVQSNKDNWSIKMIELLKEDEGNKAIEQEIEESRPAKKEEPKSNFKILTETEVSSMSFQDLTGYYNKYDRLYIADDRKEEPAMQLRRVTEVNDGSYETKSIDVFEAQNLMNNTVNKLQQKIIDDWIKSMTRELDKDAD